MTLEEAVETFDTISKHGYWTMTPRNSDAIQLGKEALKVVIKYRILGDPLSPSRLPGEDGHPSF